MNTTLRNVELTPRACLNRELEAGLNLGLQRTLILRNGWNSISRNAFRLRCLIPNLRHRNFNLTSSLTVLLKVLSKTGLRCRYADASSFVT